MSILTLGWGLLGILQKERILNALGVFSRVNLRMASFDFNKPFSKFDL